MPWRRRSHGRGPAQAAMRATASCIRTSAACPSFPVAAPPPLVPFATLSAAVTAASACDSAVTSAGKIPSASAPDGSACASATIVAPSPSTAFASLAGVFPATPYALRTAGLAFAPTIAS